MPDQPPATPTPSGTAENPTPEPEGGTSQAPAPPPGSAANAADERQLAKAERRASEQSARAEELQAALDAVNKALNPDGSTEAGQDPAQLAAAVADRDKQLGQAAAELRSAKVELAAHKSAAEYGARADRLLNSRTFLDSVSELDPDSPKFRGQVGEQIRAAVEADPDLYCAAPSGPSRGGAEFNGPPTGEQRPKSLHEAVAARLGA